MQVREAGAGLGLRMTLPFRRLLLNPPPESLNNRMPDLLETYPGFVSIRRWLVQKHDLRLALLHYPQHVLVQSTWLLLHFVTCAPQTVLKPRRLAINVEFSAKRRQPVKIH